MKIRIHPPKLAVFCFTLACWVSSSVGQTSYAFPSDSGVINVKTDLVSLGIHPTNAVGNGVTDDSNAIQAAIVYALNRNDRYSAAPLIYLPTGTYLVTRTLESRVSWASTAWSFGWHACMFLVGQSRTGTVIRLKDHCDGFTNTALPKAVIRTGSENPDDANGGGNEQAFRHSVMNLTIDVGTGNVGARGIDYLASNRGCLEDITIRSSDPNRVGITGIDMQRASTGPAMLKNVSVDGFNIGIAQANYEMSVTIENLTLTNQKTAGIRNTLNEMFIRGLTSVNTVPVIQNTGNNGFITLVNANLTGGAAGTSAITNAGKMFIRNISCSGYATVVTNNGGTTGNLQSGTTGIWTSHAQVSRFSPTVGSLSLVAEATPTYSNTDMAQWANVTSYGATKNNSSNEDADGIQAAVDSGKSIVYLPCGSYHIGKTVVIRNNVRKITGCHSGLSRKSGFTGPLFRFDGGTGSAVVLEHLYMTGGIQHNSAKSLSVRHCDINGNPAFTNTGSATGKLFVEDIISGRIILTEPLRLWARQLNVENQSPAVLNDGSVAWILGMKTEGPVVGLKTINRGVSELLGALYFHNTGKTDAATPTVEIVDSLASVSFAIGRNRATVPIRETRAGTTLDVGEFGIPNVGDNSQCCLYSSGGGTTPVIYEAENAVRSGVTVGTSQTGYSGTGYADFVNNSGDYIEWTITRSSLSKVLLGFRYANGSTDRPLELKVNGVVVHSSLSFSGTGGWSIWSKTSQAAVTLNAGSNTVRITATGSGGANIDYLSIN